MKFKRLRGIDSDKFPFLPPLCSSTCKAIPDAVSTVDNVTRGYSELQRLQQPTGLPSDLGVRSSPRDEATCDVKVKVIWLKTRSQDSVPGRGPCQGAAGSRRNAARMTAVPLESLVARREACGQGPSSLSASGSSHLLRTQGNFKLGTGSVAT